MTQISFSTTSTNITNTSNTTTTTTTTLPTIGIELDLLPHPGVFKLHPPSVSMWGDDLLSLEGWGFRPDDMTVMIGGKECKSTKDNDAQNESHFQCLTPAHPVGHHEVVLLLREAAGVTIEFTAASLTRQQVGATKLSSYLCMPVCADNVCWRASVSISVSPCLRAVADLFLQTLRRQYSHLPMA